MSKHAHESKQAPSPLEDHSQVTFESPPKRSVLMCIVGAGLIALGAFSLYLFPVYYGDTDALKIIGSALCLISGCLILPATLLKPRNARLSMILEIVGMIVLIVSAAVLFVVH